MLHVEIMFFFFSEINPKHMNALWRQNVEFMLDLMVHKLTMGL